jgi:hypothetical protein
MSQTQYDRGLETPGNQKDAEYCEIRDISSLHKYRTEMPNIIDELDLDPYEYRLYCKYKRIAGDQGMCIKSNKNLAAECSMSVRKLQQIKKSLTEPRELLSGKPLITITERKTVRGDPDTDLIKIIDIWPENFLFFIQKKSKGGASPARGVVHKVHEGGAPHAPKEELTKEEPILRTTTTLPKKAVVSKPQENSSSFFSSNEDREPKLALLKDLPINDRTRSNMCRFDVEVIKTAIENTKKSNPRDFGAYLYDQANKRYPVKRTQADVDVEKEAKRRKQEEELEGMSAKCRKIQGKVSTDMPSGASFNVHENGVVMKLPTDRGYLPLGFLESGFWSQIENFLRKLGFTPQEVMG